MDRTDLLKIGQIATLEKQVAELETKIRRHAEEVAYHSFSGAGIDKIDAGAALQAAQELKAAMDQRRELLAQLERLGG